MLYTADHLAYIRRLDLKTYKTNKLESTFFELINSKKQNILIGFIYSYPSMNQEELKKYYLNNLLEKVAMEKKQFFFLVTLISIY